MRNAGPMEDIPVGEDCDRYTGEHGWTTYQDKKHKNEYLRSRAMLVFRKAAAIKTKK